MFSPFRCSLSALSFFPYFFHNTHVNIFFDPAEPLFFLVIVLFFLDLVALAALFVVCYCLFLLFYLHSYLLYLLVHYHNIF
jgi:hypothetical protein